MEAWMLANHTCEFESVHLRHAYVHEHYRNIHLQQIFERFATGRCLDQILIELCKDCLIAQQLGWLVVYHEDIDSVFRGHPIPRPELSPALSVKPHAQSGQQLIRVDGLREVL